MKNAKSEQHRGQVSHGVGEDMTTVKANGQFEPTVFVIFGGAVT